MFLVYLTIMIAKNANTSVILSASVDATWRTMLPPFSKGITLTYADLFRRPTDKPKSLLKIGDRVQMRYGEGAIIAIRGRYIGVKADNGTTYGLEKADIKKVL